ncbi:MAG TPA: ABC transporter permease [Acidimicrobiales bacterium]|nr:ABC transporter permease [Acidimicrobiales bacterium]
MTAFLNYAIAGVPYGCDYALMAVGLVITYRATGVFNLAFGAQAFVAAFAYDLLNRYEGWPQWAAFIAAVLLISPVLGLTFDRFLFRHIPTASTTVKVISSLGLLIAIPQLIPILFGSQTRYHIAFLWLNPQIVYFHLSSSPVNGQDISTTVITVGVVLGLIAMFRWSSLGLQMRAVVESRRLSQLHGVNAAGVAAGAWAFSSAIAGLSGVLLLPAQNTLDPTAPLQFTTLLVAGMTAAALASVRSIPIAAIGGVGVGVIESVLRDFLPPGSVLGTGLLPSLPFALLVVVLLANRNLRTIEESADPLSSVDPPPPAPSVTLRDRRLDLPTRWGFRILVVAFLVSSLTWVPDNWVFPFQQGLIFSVIFLSVTLITGMSGQLSLCQATFAGIGAFTAGQLAMHFGFPMILGALVGGALAAAVGSAVSLLVSRVSGLLLTLVTLAFALFADNVLFQFSWTSGGLQGLNLPRPVIGPINFAGDRALLALVFVILLVCIEIVRFVQRGTTGEYLAAMRGSSTAAATLGINLTRFKVTVFALSAGLAGLGGALYGSSQGVVSPSDFNYGLSLVWVVVVITTGSRSVEGAVQSGMAFTIIAQILTYLPQRIQGIEFVLFAFGALTYAAHPEGIVEYQKSQWMRRVARVLRAWDERRGRAPEPAPGAYHA